MAAARPSDCSTGGRPKLGCVYQESDGGAWGGGGTVVRLGVSRNPVRMLLTPASRNAANFC